MYNYEKYNIRTTEFKLLIFGGDDKFYRLKTN